MQPLRAGATRAVAPRKAHSRARKRRARSFDIPGIGPCLNGRRGDHDVTLNRPGIAGGSNS